MVHMETQQTKKHKILVVDDNRENIRIIGSILRQNGYKAGFATSGQQALDILEPDEEEYDLVLLDVNMPGKNGFEVCREMRKVESLKTLPVIFLTANTESEQIIEGFNCGGQDYVTKPFHAGELMARISTHLELKDSREKLMQINELLEEKVKERTSELEIVNHQLEAANHELQALDGAKADFLSIISHEINTPLNGIIGFADILTEELNNTEYFNHVKYLNESAHRLNDFAQLSLLITILRTTPSKYNFEPIDLRQPLEEALWSLDGKLSQKNLKKEYTGLVENPTVSGNSFLLTIAFTNILKNAIQHAPEGSELVVEIKQHEKSYIVLMEDKGKGFSASALQNLFIPFSTGMRHIDKNMGLGLHLVKLIIDLHHAYIEVANGKNSGAQVIVSFNKLLE